MKPGQLNLLFRIEETPERKGRWVRCGTAFKTKDGQEYTLVVDAIPVHFSGTFYLLPAESHEK